jgi:hypothetical protein
MKTTRRNLLFGLLARGDEQRLDRNDLLLFRDGRGSVRRAANVRDWNNRRQEIVRGMQDVMGRLPGAEKRCPLDMRVEEESDTPSFVRRLISYAAEPGSRVPAFLLIPRSVVAGGRKATGVLCLHPTDDRFGHRVVVEDVGKPGRQYAAELADRGFVTLAPSYPLLANYQPDLRALGYRSGTMKAIWDNVRALDLLDSLPFVRSGVYGSIGHSLGGHNAVYTAVFENRIRVIVSSCGLDSYLDYKGGDIRGWTSPRYMPALLDYRNRLAEIPFDFGEMIGALAPRVCFLSAPRGDDNFQWQSVDRVAAAAKPVYRLYRKERNLIVKHPDCGHDFPDEMRTFAYSLLSRLNGGAA